MSQPNPLPSPERIFTLLHGFHHTAVLKTAIELDLFTHLAAGATTADALAQRTHAAPRGVRILCNALVVYGLLEKNGDQYRPAPDAALFLNRNSPAYLGGVTGFLLSPT
ncbi:MAG TPA: methyltransferase dimerization domain-containing protein, partial [Terriglobales bacterium]|nr:methyltransferase dimerization domain-containing protein [Terriglobales bacterium]